MQQVHASSSGVWKQSLNVREVAACHPKIEASGGPIGKDHVGKVVIDRVQSCCSMAADNSIVVEAPAGLRRLEVACALVVVDASTAITATSVL